MLRRFSSAWYRFSMSIVEDRVKVRRLGSLLFSALPLGFLTICCMLLTVLLVISFFIGIEVITLEVWNVVDISDLASSM